MKRPQIYQATVIMCIAVLMTGCTTASHRPELARRPLSGGEASWAQKIEAWYPTWHAPVLPLSTRRLSAPVAGIPPTPTQDPPPAVRIAPPPSAPPVETTNAAPSGQLPPLISNNPSHSIPPAATQAFHLVPADGVAPPDGRTYRVQKGDTLNAIALKVYGDSSAWRKIFQANRDIIAHPNQLRSGTTLRMP